MKQCPGCQATERQVKSGKHASGSQRWKCQACGRRYTPEPSQHGYDQAVREQAIKLYVDGQNYRRIARQIGVSYQSVINWCNAYSARLPQQAPQPAHVTTIEMDELFTFVGSKKTKSTS
jgi:transposase-like protein